LESIAATKTPQPPISIKAGAQSRWLAKTLDEFGHEVIVANQSKYN